MPRNGLYGAGGETWRHISQSGRVPPDRRLIKLAGTDLIVTAIGEAIIIAQAM